MALVNVFIVMAFSCLCITCATALAALYYNIFKNDVLQAEEILVWTKDACKCTIVFIGLVLFGLLFI